MLAPGKEHDASRPRAFQRLRRRIEDGDFLPKRISLERLECFRREQLALGLMLHQRIRQNQSYHRLINEMEPGIIVSSQGVPSSITGFDRLSREIGRGYRITARDGHSSTVKDHSIPQASGQ